MVSTVPEAPTISLLVTHAGQTLSLSLVPSSPLSSLIAQLSSHFNLSPSSLKLVVKGKKLSLDYSSAPGADQQTAGAAFKEAFGLVAAFKEAFGLVAEGRGRGEDASKPVKALLVGTKQTSFDSLQAAETLREKKHQAFLHHQSRPPPPPSRVGGVHTIGGGEDDPERYRFYDLQPFPESVPQLEKRKAMLSRLAEDKAVRDVMRRHKLAVGVLCVCFLSFVTLPSFLSLLFLFFAPFPPFLSTPILACPPISC
jgi:hypothetical protein